MSSVFTDFVLELEPGSGGPSAELCEHLWQALRGTLAIEMKRRSAWQTRPSFLGIVGHGQWVEPHGKKGGSDALDELTSDCFEFIFVRRIEGLRRQARRKPNVDGLIHLGVRHFLLDVQSRNDPLGFRVFEVLRATVQQMVVEERLWVISGSAKIRNETCLAFNREVRPEEVRGVDLAPLIGRWVDLHLEALVIASHGSLADLQLALAEELTGFLENQGRGFRFGDLVAPLKRQVRHGWAARFLNLPNFLTLTGEEGVTEAAPEAELASEQRHFSAVVRCIDAVREPGLNAKNREYIDRLWSYLKGFAFEDLRALYGSTAEASTIENDTLPSQRQLTALLGIPRARISELLERLRGRWQQCQEKLGLSREDDGMKRSSDAPGAASPKDRALAALRTVVTASRQESEGAKFSWVEASALLPGDLFVVPDADLDDIEWLVIAPGATQGVLRCAPTDSCPLVGEADLDLRWEDEDGPPRIVRLALEISADVALLGSVELTGHLDGRLLENAQGRLQEGEPSEADSLTELPAYRDWLEEGPARARAAFVALVESRRPVAETGASVAPAHSQPAHRRFPRVVPWIQYAAAAMLVVSVGITTTQVWRGAKLQRLVDQLSAPIVDLPVREIQMAPEVRGTWQLEIPARATHVQVAVVLVDQPSFPAYRLDIVQATGELIFRTEPLAPRSEYTVTLPVHLLRPGQVEVRLFGLNGKEATLLKQEDVEILGLD